MNRRFVTLLALMIMTVMVSDLSSQTTGTLVIGTNTVGVGKIDTGFKFFVDGTTKVNGTLTATNMNVTGAVTTGNKAGTTEGVSVESLNTDCPGGKVMIGLGISRFRKDDGDVDTYQFTPRCR